ncbi:MAG TPA: hypothetical protein VLM36_08455, partial [Sphingomicrobium sp.]|nr:hypothetical protein [Sphingomicrobium sp.]
NLPMDKPLFESFVRLTPIAAFTRVAATCSGEMPDLTGEGLASLQSIRVDSSFAGRVVDLHAPRVNCRE